MAQKLKKSKVEARSQRAIEIAKKAEGDPQYADNPVLLVRADRVHLLNLLRLLGHLLNHGDRIRHRRHPSDEKTGEPEQSGLLGSRDRYRDRCHLADRADLLRLYPLLTRRIMILETSLI